jgi:hypothetical protein
VASDCTLAVSLKNLPVALLTNLALAASLSNLPLALAKTLANSISSVSHTNLTFALAWAPANLALVWSQQHPALRAFLAKEEGLARVAFPKRNAA